MTYTISCENAHSSSPMILEISPKSCRRTGNIYNSENFTRSHQTEETAVHNAVGKVSDKLSVVTFFGYNHFVLYNFDIFREKIQWV